MTHVHPTAHVHETATLGPGAVVGAHSVLGAGCTLHPYSIVGPHTTLGPGCVLHPFAVIGGPAQEKHTDPDAPFTLVCGAENVFREGVTASRGTEGGGGTTRLGDGNLLMANSHVAHDCRIGDGCTFANGVSLAGHVEVGDQVTFGGHAAVHQFTRIGDLAFVAANGMANFDVPPFCLAAGDRAALIGLNGRGLLRAGVSAADRSALKRAFLTIFGAPRRRQAAEAFRDDPIEPVSRLAAFILASQRGVMRWRLRERR